MCVPASCVILLDLYARLPAASLCYLYGLLRYGVSKLAVEVRQLREHAKSRYANAHVDGQLGFWSQRENLMAHRGASVRG